MSCAEPTRVDQHPPRPKRSRWKDHAKRLALLGCTLLLLTACAEIATRLLTDAIPQLTVKDPVLGQRYVRSFEGKIFDPEAGREVRLRFNRVGFRGPDRPLEKPPGVRRVAVLGDSMVAAQAVDEDDTMVGQLQRMLNESQRDVKWEVLNFGVPGASPGQEMVLYKKLVARWDPDVVLCAFYVGNDLADNCSRLSHNPRIYFDLDDRGNPYQMPFSAKRIRVSQFLNRYSRFYVWQRIAVNNARHRVVRKIKMLSPGEWIYCSRESEKLAHAWRLSGELARAFHQEVETRGGLFAMVMIPSACQIYEDRFRAVAEMGGKLAEYFDPDYPDRRMGGLCREAGVPLLSMTADFRAAAPSASSKVKDEWLFFGGHGHFNERGHRLAAQSIHRFLTRDDPQHLAGEAFVRRLR